MLKLKKEKKYMKSIFVRLRIYYPVDTIVWRGNWPRFPIRYKENAAAAAAAGSHLYIYYSIIIN